MHIVIASGKGGTGKTTVAVNLAFILSTEQRVVLADCDVEEPNLHLFFQSQVAEKDVTLPVPDIEKSTCILCGKCGEFCRYGALIVLNDQVLQYPNLCHSCGGCSMVCPVGSISERPEIIGKIQVSDPDPSLHLVTGVLREGSIHSPAMIRAVRKELSSDDLVILDAPPGTSCAAMEALEGCDLCVLVTEPTPFGLHDLMLIYQVVRMFEIPVAVVINRNDNQDTGVESFCREQSIPVILKIPFDRDIALKQGRGRIISRDDPVWREPFSRMAMESLKLAGA